MTILINGLTHLEQKVAGIGARIQRNKDRAARGAAVLIARAVRREAPRLTKAQAGKQAGKLRRSVRVRRIPGGYRVKPEARSAHLVIRGTKPHLTMVKQAEALHFQAGGDDVFVHSAHHPGARANPFVNRAFSFATREEAKLVAKEVLFHDAPVPDE